MRWAHRDVVLTLCTAALFVTVFGRLALSPVVPEIASEFDVSNGRIGLALSGMWLAYALTQLPSGVLADRYGDRAVMFVSVAGTGVTTLLVVLAPGYLVFSVGVFLLGGVAGLHYSVGTAVVTRLYDRTGTAIGLHNSGATIAGVLAPVIVAWIAVCYGWRPAVATTLVVALPIAGLIHVLLRDRQPRRPNGGLIEGLAIDRARSVLARPAVGFTVLIAVISDFTWQAIASFLPTFLVQYHGFSGTVAGVLFAGYFLAQGGLQVVVGMIADRFGHDAAITACMFAGMLGIGLLITDLGLIAVGAGIVLLGASMGFGAAVFPRVMSLFTEEDQGYGFGAFRTVYMVFSASGPAVVGTIADRFGWSASFGFLAGLLGVVVLLQALNRVSGRRY